MVSCCALLCATIKTEGENRRQLNFLLLHTVIYVIRDVQVHRIFPSYFFDSQLLDYLWADCIPVPPRHGAAFWLKNTKRFVFLVYSYRRSWLKVRSSLAHSIWFIALFIIMFNSIIALLHANLLRSSYILALYEGEQTFARFKPSRRRWEQASGAPRVRMT